ncbi:membrane protein insertase YidC [Parabacteroides distasonis]|nr:membrane protein insertase YidC [Parabacteroides distasonis]
MDKNTITGFVLIGIVLLAFSWINRPTPEQIEAQRRYQDSIAHIEQVQQQEWQASQLETTNDLQALQGLPDSVREARLQASYGSFSTAMTGTEGYTTLENDRVEIRISNRGGRVCYARLKEYDTHDGQPLVLFEDKESQLDFTLVTANNQAIHTSDLYFSPVKGNDPNQVIMRLSVGHGQLDFIYTLQPDDYMLQFTLQGSGMNGILSPTTQALDMNWEQDIRQQEKGRSFENRYVALYYKIMGDDVENLAETSHANKQVEERLKWIGYKDMFFSTVLISKAGFDKVSLDSKVYASGTTIKHFKSTASVPFDLQGKQATELQYYFGPNKFASLKAYDEGLSDEERLDLAKLVPLGWGIFRWVNQYFVIPLFDFLGKFISSYGLLIFILTLIVKTILFPLTRKSYLSSAKMRVLRPQVEEINAKYPGNDQAMERQRATMELYSRVGASPMSGCLPMLLQMPVLIALFMFFPSAIELRHQSFLWAHDLSTYDAVISWETNIPLVSTYFGNHISLFCLLMTITNIFYTKYNMEMTNTGQQQMPGMQVMMYMMPLMFLVFFNQYASGLTYYYFISTLITIVQTLIFRYTVDEEKLLAKLEANKRKPVKRSGFLKRLEEIQKAQEAQLERQKQQRKH